MMVDHMTSRRQHKGRRQHDALVPIRSDRLRAAMELGEWTVTRLAKRLGRKENPQTVHYLAQGDGLKRCRTSRRGARAKLLDVTEDCPANGPDARHEHVARTGAAVCLDARAQKDRSEPGGRSGGTRPSACVDPHSGTVA